MPLNRRRSGEPRTAALVPATDVRSRMRTSSTTGEKWQRQIIKYDREGPGILGYYLDTVALLASLCPLTVEVRQKDGTWARSDDPVLAVAMAGYKSKLAGQTEIVAAHTRHREALGECWIIYSDDLGWVVQTIPNVTVAAGGDVVDFTDFYGNKRRVSKDRVWKSWVPDPYEPWLPTSPVRRGLPELRRLNASTRNQTRSAESRLVTNGLIAFKPDASGTRPLRSAADGGPQRDGAEKIVDDFITLSQEAFHDDDAPSASVPFPYVGEPAVPVDLGRGIDSTAIQVEDKALEAFARAVNFPAQLLTLGPGAANHWNEWLLQEAQHKMGLAPKLLPVCADITEFYLRPMVARIRNRVGSWDIRPEAVRVGFDMSFLTKKPDLSGQALEAYRLGIISREEVNEQLGITKPLEIPVGLSEYEHWELATGSKGAPYAEVDADGRLILPPPDQGMDMGGGMEPLPAEEPLLDEEPLPAEEPAAETAPFSPEDAVMTEGEMPQPPPQIAAASPSNPMMYLPETLAEVDKSLEAELMGLSTAIQTAIRAEVAKEAIKMLPPRSPERVALRELSPDEVWQQIPDDVRAQVDVRAIAEREAAKYQQQVEEAFSAAADAATEAWANTGLTAPEFLVAVGAAVLLLAVADEVTDALGALVSAPIDAADALVPDRRRRLRPVRGRTVIVRSGMSAAAGARIDATGRIQKSEGGTPIAENGQPWQGSTGMALGDRSARQMAQTGDDTGQWRMRYRWEHSFFGKPDTPYPPHLALDGRYFRSLADVPGGLFPGDHPWCRCAFLWAPERLT